ncbi:MAG: GNAT family N-acetyltransferase, partial [Deltaproteobacteria bacterium]|nr:GNAT family N-acetyltransferase [Deltaproteobacteria bacterium]
SQDIHGFLGAQGQKIEMLFLAPGVIGQGLGRLLIEWAVSRTGAFLVDVNEDNLSACGFYRHLGFEVFSRSPLDSQGNPFPILHLALACREISAKS